MYNDNTFNGLFTGTLSGGVYTYPSAEQNLVVKFANFYLSAKDGDFTTDPVTITSETGEGEDISIGNAPAKVLTATMLNPAGAMDALTWGDGSVYIGAETASASADTYNSYPVHILAGSVHYGINSSGNARRNTTNYTLGGTPVAVISNSAGNDVLFITSTKIGRYNGSFSTITTPTAEQAYLAAKFRAMPHSVGVLLDANGLPSVYNSVAEGTKQTFSYVPMGVFDFSGVDAYGITFGVEAYDKMTVFDADATEWWNAIDFTAGKQLQTLAGEVVSHYGLTLATLPNTAVNKTVSWNTNPITSYAVTGRDLLKWLAEAMGCNVRMSRTGTVEFWTFNTTAVASITPDTIVSSTRVVGRKSVPAVTQTVCYNVLGAGYTATGSTTTGTTYYVVANPFIDPSTNLAPLNAIHGVVTAVPAYYPVTIAVSCADARWDAGDFVTITDTDNNSITVPIMHQAMEWNGMCHATLSATGKQVRDVPESMLNTDLSSMVDSNPSAVVNKIQAVGISADWITSGKLTVLDSNDDVLFDADKDNDSVEIAGFTVTDQSLDYTLTEPSDVPGYDKTTSIHFGTDGVLNEVVDWNLSSNNTPFSVNSFVRLNDAFIRAKEDNSNDPDTPYVTQANYMADNILFTKKENGVTTNIAEFTYRDCEISDYTTGNTTTMTGSGVTADNGTNTTTMSATGVTFDDGGLASTLRVRRFNHVSPNTTTITLEQGAYLAITTRYNNSNTSYQGLALIQAYNGTSCILDIASATNSTLSISGLTLTWTTTSTNYRALRLIQLT